MCRNERVNREKKVKERDTSERLKRETHLKERHQKETLQKNKLLISHQKNIQNRDIREDKTLKKIQER